MLQFVFESPWLVGICGLLLTLAAGFLWVQTGTRSSLLVAIAIAMLTGGAIIASLWIETDREQIVRTINQVANAVRANDLPSVLRLVHPSATAGVVRAEQELPQYKFSEARMTKLHSLVVDRRARPATAVAEFNVIVALEANGQKLRVPRFVKAYFSHDGQRWLVRDYEHFDAQRGFTKD